MQKERLGLAVRILVNIGLCLQFYIPVSIFLWIGIGGLIRYANIDHTDPNFRGAGMLMVGTAIMLFFAVMHIAFLLYYLYWDRYGKSAEALEFLFYANLAIILLWGGALFYYDFSWRSLADPEIILFSPVHIILGTAFFGTAMIVGRDGSASIS